MAKLSEPLVAPFPFCGVVEGFIERFPKAFEDAGDGFEGCPVGDDQFMLLIDDVMCDEMEGSLFGQI